jgi:hypothetical protein
MEGIQVHARSFVLASTQLIRDIFVGHALDTQICCESAYLRALAPIHLNDVHAVFDTQDDNMHLFAIVFRMHNSSSHDNKTPDI